MPRRTVCLALLLLLLCGSRETYTQTTATNQPSSGELDATALLKEIADNYKNWQRYQVVMVRTNDNTTTGYGLTSNNHTENRYEITVEAANRYRIESSSSYDKSVVVSDGTTRWAYNANRKQFIKKEANAPVSRPEAGQPILDPTYFALQQLSVISGLGQVANRIPKLTVLGEEMLNHNGQITACLVLHLAVSQNFDRKLWIDKTRKLILRDWSRSHFKNSTMETLSENVTQSDFTFLKANEPLPAELFSFTPPAGVVEVAEFKLPPQPSPTGPNLNGKDALPFALKDLNGDTIDLTAYKGKVVLLDFWASWCGPCVAEMPHIQKLHEELKEKGLVVLGINAEELAVAKDFMKDKGYTFSSLVDVNRAVANQYEVNGIPQLFLISRAGVIKWSALGYRSGREAEVKAAIEKLLNNEEPLSKTGTIGQAQTAPNRQ